MTTRRLLLVVPVGTEVTIVRPGRRTMGLRADALVVDRDALIGVGPTEQAMVDNWFSSSVMTCLRPNAPTVMVEYD